MSNTITVGVRDVPINIYNKIHGLAKEKKQSLQKFLLNHLTETFADSTLIGHIKYVPTGVQICTMCSAMNRQTYLAVYSDSKTVVVCQACAQKQQTSEIKGD